MDVTADFELFEEILEQAVGYSGQLPVGSQPKHCTNKENTPDDHPFISQLPCKYSFDVDNDTSVDLTTPTHLADSEAARSPHLADSESVVSQRDILSASLANLVLDKSMDAKTLTFACNPGSSYPNDVISGATMLEDSLSHIDGSFSSPLKSWQRRNNDTDNKNSKFECASDEDLICRDCFLRGSSEVRSGLCHFETSEQVGQCSVHGSVANDRKEKKIEPFVENSKANINILSSPYEHKSVHGLLDEHCLHLNEDHFQPEERGMESITGRKTSTKDNGQDQRKKSRSHHERKPTWKGCTCRSCLVTRLSNSVFPELRRIFDGVDPRICAYGSVQQPPFTDKRTKKTKTCFRSSERVVSHHRRLSLSTKNCDLHCEFSCNHSRGSCKSSARIAKETCSAVEARLKNIKEGKHCMMERKKERALELEVCREKKDERSDNETYANNNNNNNNNLFLNKCF